MKIIYWSVIILIGSAILIWAVSVTEPGEQDYSDATLISQFEQPTDFMRAERPREWKFPEDLGAHPDFQTEWWYYTGNLKAENGELFGYQLTFFRRALLSASDRSERESDWATSQVYMGHFALSDVSAEQHYSFERFSRGAAGLAGAGVKPFQVWLENWEVLQVGDDEYRLRAQSDGISIDLILNDLKGPVFHGEGGLSQKGPEKGNASYYFSQTRLESEGMVEIQGKSYPVSGLSWMDHEFSTSALSQGQVGWDWFSIQLDNKAELMVFQIRRSDGSIDPFSRGTWVRSTSETMHLEDTEFEIQVLDTWRSPTSGADYPMAWTIKVPDLEAEFELQPYFPDQEMNVSYAYWEGAVQVIGTLNRNPISGSGYVEMTGYASSMEGEF